MTRHMVILIAAPLLFCATAAGFSQAHRAWSSTERALPVWAATFSGSTNFARHEHAANPTAAYPAEVSRILPAAQ